MLHSMSKKENFFPPWEKSNVVNANYNATKTPSLVYVVVLEIKTLLPCVCVGNPVMPHLSALLKNEVLHVKKKKKMP